MLNGWGHTFWKIVFALCGEWRHLICCHLGIMPCCMHPPWHVRSPLFWNWVLSIYPCLQRRWDLLRTGCCAVFSGVSGSYCFCFFIYLWLIQSVVSHIPPGEPFSPRLLSAICCLTEIWNNQESGGLSKRNWGSSLKRRLGVESCFDQKFYSGAKTTFLQVCPTSTFLWKVSFQQLIISNTADCANHRLFSLNTSLFLLVRLQFSSNFISYIGYLGLIMSIKLSRVLGKPDYYINEK